MIRRSAPCGAGGRLGRYGVKRRSCRLALASLMAVAATVFAAAGSAGSRAVNVSFDVFPAPAEVSYGHQIAYRATFENTSGSLAKVLFRQTFPVPNGAE